MIMDILNYSARELNKKIVNQDITSVQVIEEYFKNIEKIEKDINAFISLDRDLALSKAKKIDEKIENGEDVGLLAGLPISIKDNIVTKDFNTTAGSKMLENFKSPYNASVVEKIENEDGIIIGKTNMDEFAVGGTGEKSYFGATKNPINLEKITGGSSSGSAASIKSKEAILSIGTDTGGSVRHPASYCDIVGLKPSYGLVSKYGVIPLSNTLDTVGVLARNVLDAAYMLNIVSGKDEKDSSTLESQKIDIDSIKENDSIEGIKIAMPKQFIMSESERECKTELSKAVKIFKELGAEIHEIDMPILDEVEKTYQIITSGDFSSNMARYDGIRYGYRSENYNTLNELYMKSRGESFGLEVKKRILFGTYVLSENRGRTYYDKALLVRRKIINAFNELFEEYDIILGLSSSMTPGKLGEKRSDELKRSENLFQMPANLAGLCSISVPAKTNKLPIGIQIIGNRFDEEKIIKAAFAYERMVR